MIASVVLALVCHGHSARLQAVNSGMLWEQTVIEQQFEKYLPMIRFNTPSTMIRFSPSQNYMFTTPDMIQQGQFSVQGNHYHFRAVSAFELENADIAKLQADMNPKAAKGLGDAYARSMNDFDGDFNRQSQTLTIWYRFKGMLTPFQLHATTEGDAQLPLILSSSAAALVGLWHAPEPFPDKLDARTRAKIELGGLQHFANEAMASNAAQFSLLDLRRDGTYRMHGKVDNWQRNGSILILMDGGKKTILDISADGAKLLSRGKPVYVRN